MPMIRMSLADNIGTISLDHDDKRNALGRELVGEMLSALDGLRADRARAVVLRTASGGAVWSAGHDIDELPKAHLDPLPFSDPLERLLRAVKSFPAPVIAMVQGSVWGGASDLIMACDLVLGDETAAFAVTPARLGLPYNVAGILNFMSRLPLHVVKELFFTAEPIRAERAERVGILNRLVPAAELEAETYGLARSIASRSAASITACKEAFRCLSEAVAVNPSTYEYLHGLRRDVYLGPDYTEGIAAFLERRPPKF